MCNSKTPVEEAKIFPAVDGVDWEYALFRMKDALLLKKTAEDFITMAEGEKEKLKQAYAALCDSPEESGFAAYRIRVHSMKSSTAMIGAMFVAALAKKLESAAGAGDKEQVQSFHALFLAQWEQLTKDLSLAFPKEEQEEEGQEADADTLRKLLADLNAAMDEFDVDAADAIIGQMSAYRFGEKKPLFEKLKAAVQNLDRDAVKSTSEEF